MNNFEFEANPLIKNFAHFITAVQSYKHAKGAEMTYDVRNLNAQKATNHDKICDLAEQAGLVLALDIFLFHFCKMREEITALQGHRFAPKDAELYDDCLQLALDRANNQISEEMATITQQATQYLHANSQYMQKFNLTTPIRDGATSVFSGLIYRLSLEDLEAFQNGQKNPPPRHHHLPWQKP